MGLNPNIDDFSDIPYRINFGMLTEIVESITYIASFLLGLAALFIASFMVLVTAVDIAFLTIPILQDFVHERGWDGSREGNGTKIALVSRDAVNALEEAYTSGHVVRSSVGIYIKKRLSTYMKAAFVLAILVLGSQLLTDAVWSVVEPLFRAFHLIT